MKVICAWCQADMGKKEPMDDPSISHGQCRKCAAEMEKELLDPLKAFNRAFEEAFLRRATPGD